MSTSWKSRFCKTNGCTDFYSFNTCSGSVSLKKIFNWTFPLNELICNLSSFFYFTKFPHDGSGLFYWNCCSTEIASFESFHGQIAGKCWVRYFGLDSCLFRRRSLAAFVPNESQCAITRIFPAFIGEMMIQFLQFFRAMTKESKENVHLFCFQ